MTARSDARIAAVAPSVSPAELPAVTRPAARNGVDSAASPSSVVSGPQELVPVGHRPTGVGEDRHRHDRLGHDAVGPGRRGPLLRAQRVLVGHLARQLGKAVVEVLGCLTHDGGALVDDSLREEARVEVDVAPIG